MQAKETWHLNVMSNPGVEKNRYQKGHFWDNGQDLNTYYTVWLDNGLVSM